MSRQQVILLPVLPTEVAGPLAERYDVIDWRNGPSLNSSVKEVRALACSSKAVVDEALLAQLPSLELISSYSAGLDGIDIDAAAARGVQIANTAEALADDVADLALGHIIAVTRGIGSGERYLRAGRWAREGYMPVASSIQGKVLGLLGFGTIGSRISTRAAAFGLRVLYHTRHPRSSGAEYVPTLQELAERSDYLVVTCPLTSETRGLIDLELLRRLGPAGYLINVARGPIVVERDLVTALDEGAIAGAGLDVFEDEPNIAQTLLHREDVVLTPHIGSATSATRQAMADMTVRHIVSLLG